MQESSETSPARPSAQRRRSASRDTRYDVSSEAAHSNATELSLAEAHASNHAIVSPALMSPGDITGRMTAQEAAADSASAAVLDSSTEPFDERKSGNAAAEVGSAATLGRTLSAAQSVGNGTMLHFTSLSRQIQPTQMEEGAAQLAEQLQSGQTADSIVEVVQDRQDVKDALRGLAQQVESLQLSIGVRNPPPPVSAAQLVRALHAVRRTCL